MRIEGIISQNNELLVDGCLRKGENKFQSRFKIDTGFIGYDVAIPANIAGELGLNPSKVEKFSIASGSIKLLAGDDVILCLGNKQYRASYVIYYSRVPLLSVNFLKNITEIMIVDFIRNSVVIVLK
ncbi:hypothetical protein [Acidianus sp. HS-5]|uniref:hypothetical protein n=1 Tax=Acidianus sp. HS-5 TaxID=2886040 RepID=UPI001F16BF4C|nr:hypothetical protein [Acidianus sp. HS-5]BDC17450.1 hypothetical protein HS5_03400 [Acidianus sp. HS-5]